MRLGENCCDRVNAMWLATFLVFSLRCIFRKREVNTYKESHHVTRATERSCTLPRVSRISVLAARAAEGGGSRNNALPNKRQDQVLVNNNPNRSKRKPRPCRINHEQEPGLESQLSYARNGHTVLRGLVDADLILGTLRPKLLEYAHQHELAAWKQKVEVSAGPRVAKSCTTVLECRRELEKFFHRSELSLPFLQYFNTWRSIAQLENLAKSELLARSAACLMNVPTVRLYQDSLFWKRSGDGPTPWHVDARMAPFDTANMITFWIPLQDILSHEDSALVFCSASHCDFALPFWNPVVPTTNSDDVKDSEWHHLEERYGSDALVDYIPLRVGDVTVHSGWTLHCADAKPTGTMNKDRLALAITYVDGRAPVRRDAVAAASTNSGRGDNEDAWSYNEWVGCVAPMQRNFTHKLVPMVWPVPKSKKSTTKLKNHNRQTQIGRQ